MALVRDTIAHFIEQEGHRVDISPVDADGTIAEILFRTRGQLFSVTTSESEPGVFTLSTAYEIPDWAQERSQNAETLVRVNQEYPGVAFAMAHDGALFVATSREEHDSPQAFAQSFWESVARLREAGTQAIERILDRTESKSAAEKFINSFMGRSQ
jgi:hypothetical protein